VPPARTMPAMTAARERVCVLERKIYIYIYIFIHIYIYIYIYIYIEREREREREREAPCRQRGPCQP